jgi:23S rRNA (adenine2503-C2)-methyltransferase
LTEIAATEELPARPDLLELPPSRVETLLEEYFQKRGQGKFRVRQALAWLYERDAMSFDEMTDLPARAREALKAAFDVTAPVLARAEQSTDGTVKHLWQMRDGELLESVLIPTPGRITLCVSSQAGCAMACTFCATGWSGYRRNLTPGEIVAQFAVHGAGRASMAAARSPTSCSWAWVSRS